MRSRNGRRAAAVAVGVAVTVVGSGLDAQAPSDTYATTSPCDDTPPPAGATLTPSRDLYCVFLTARPGLEGMSGRLELRTPHSPFGVAVNAAGNHLYDGILTLDGLPDPATLGDYDHIVAWLATPLFDTVVNLGPVSNGTRSIGEVSLNKFMILVTAEPRPDAPEWEGRLLLRATSPSARMSPPDLQEYIIGAGAGGSGTGMAGHDHAGMGADAANGPWPRPSMMPGLTMFPALMALDPPTAAPYLPGADIDPATLPLARPRDVIQLGDGDEIDLEAGLVRRRIRSRDYVMYGFNGQYPGPLLHVPEAATITVNFTNSIAWPTTIHWHGLRLDNASDGVPGVTQEPVEPGETFRYEIHFKDPGLYWYHPHHREDVLKDLGLYGNMLVEPSAPDYFGPVDREEFLMVDDFLMTGDDPLPFGLERSTHSFMGRFGNLMLTNGEPDYELEVTAGEVIRLYLTNVSNTRTFNLSFEREGGGGGQSPDARIKVVGTDIGAFEREEWVESIVLSPAERYIVHVRFEEAGDYALVNRVQGIDHLAGAFLPGDGQAGNGACGIGPHRAGRRTLTRFARLRHTAHQPPRRPRDRPPARALRRPRRPRTHLHPGSLGHPLRGGPADALRFRLFPPGGVERDDADDELELVVRRGALDRAGAFDRPREHGHRVAVPGRGRGEDPPAQRAAFLPRHAAPLPHPRPALPGAQPQRGPQREPRVEGHRAAAHREPPPTSCWRSPTPAAGWRTVTSPSTWRPGCGCSSR